MGSRRVAASDFGSRADQRAAARGASAQCRRLATVNEFAINGHENRISYIVGAGHSYHATVRKGMERRAGAGDGQCRSCSTSFYDENRWHQRQQEIVRRMDRDGEAFLRFFVDRAGLTRVRFIEPDQVRHARRRATDPSASFGIQTDPQDVETVLGYYVDGQLVDAARRAAPPGERRPQRQARPAALHAGAEEPASGREAAAEHERRGRDPIGDRADPQAPRRESQRRRAVRRRRVPTRRRTSAPTAGRGTSRNTARARSSTPRPASNTTSPPPASTRPASSRCCRPSCGRSPRGW